MLHGSARGRVPLSVSTFDDAFNTVNKQLEELGMPTIISEEFLGTRMYTGPCFVKYNTVLRGLQSAIDFFKNMFMKLCNGNKCVRPAARMPARMRRRRWHERSPFRCCARAFPAPLAFMLTLRCARLVCGSRVCVTVSESRARGGGF